MRASTGVPVRLHRGTHHRFSPYREDTVYSRVGLRDSVGIDREGVEESYLRARTFIRFGITQVLFEETDHGFSSSLELGHGARLVEPAGEACVFLIIFRVIG